MLGLDPSSLQVVNTTLADTPGNVGDEPVEHIDCRPPKWQLENGSGAQAGHQGPSDGDDNNDDVDPRTLAAAAARLAQYTSEQPVTALPQQQWADIYKETGLDDVSADVACEMVVWRCGGGSDGHGWAPTDWRLSCGAHKV
jgi:KUP system potassium uptake protein